MLHAKHYGDLKGELEWDSALETQIPMGDRKHLLKYLSHKVRSVRCLGIGVPETWVQLLIPSDQLCDVGGVPQPL